MRIVLSFVPVIHQGYLRLLSVYPDAQIYIWGKSLVLTEDSLRKEIRALEPNVAQAALRAILSKEVYVAETTTLAQIAAQADPLILPDDAISHRLVQRVLVPLGLRKWVFLPVFLRWDSNNAATACLVQPDQTMLREDLGSVVNLAEMEAAQSSDWWRQVGAVLFDTKGRIYLTGHNRHLPTDFTPYVDGDARGGFSKGVQVELSTAIHAEAFVIATAARLGVETQGLKLFVTVFPCPACAKLIAASGIAELFYSEGYSMVDGERVLRDHGVRIVHVI